MLDDWRFYLTVPVRFYHKIGTSFGSHPLGLNVDKLYYCKKNVD